MATGHEAPLRLHTDRVREEWIDVNDHMNVAYYVLAFDHATDAFFDYIGLDDSHRRQTNCATFAAECHVTYKQEVLVGDELGITTQLLAYDAKRIHYFHRMYQASSGYLAATCEWLNLHVDLAERRVVPMPASVQSRLSDIARTHGALDWPDEAGRRIAVPNPVGYQR